MAKSGLYVLAAVCGFGFLAFLIFAGSVVETFKALWACRSAWWLLIAALVVSIALLGFWAGLALYFSVFWVIAFFTSGVWETLVIIIKDRQTAIE